MPGLDAEIDRLYALPLTAFTAVRNELARAHGGATGAAIRRLAKPTTTAWAVNQLYWHDRRLWQRLMQAGRALRAAQIAALEGRRSDVRKAAEAHRRELSEALQHVLQRASSHGVQPLAEPVARMLETVSLSDPVEHAGRFTETMRPAGFEALAGVTPVARPRAGMPPAPRRAATRRGEDRAAAAARAAATRAAEEAVARAARALAAAEDGRRRAEQRASEARQRLASAEDALARTCEEVATAARALEAARETSRRAG